MNPKLYNVCWTINKLAVEFSSSSTSKNGPNFLFIFFSLFFIISDFIFLFVSFGFSSNLKLSIRKSELELLLISFSSNFISSYEYNILLLCLHFSSSNIFFINDSK